MSCQVEVITKHDHLGNGDRLSLGQTIASHYEVKIKPLSSPSLSQKITTSNSPLSPKEQSLFDF